MRQHIEITDLNKDDRSRLRGIVGWILAASFIGGVVIYSMQAWAEEVPVHVYEQDGLVVRLLSSPCVDPASQMTVYTQAPQYLERLKALDSVWRMKDGTTKPFKGCWLELSKEEVQGPEDVFVLLFEDGDRGVMPKSEFVKKRGQSGA
jgi:hypothetical protein